MRKPRLARNTGEETDRNSYRCGRNREHAIPNMSVKYIRPQNDVVFAGDHITESLFCP